MARRLLAAVIVLSSILMGQAALAQGQQQCGPHADVLRMLFQNYGESVVAAGVTAGGNMLEVLASPDGSTWTIVGRTPNGMACLMAAGENWRSAEPAKPGQES